MIRLLVAGLLFSLAFAAKADGLPLENGRYPGPVLVFDLTPEQKAVIDHFRTCHLEQFKEMNQYTPYIFTLTPKQAMALKDKKGIVPSYFEVYETYIGFNDAGPHWNLALRFTADQVEIPLDLVISDNEALDFHRDQGWKQKNPCFPKLGKVTSNTAFDTDVSRRSTQR